MLTAENMDNNGALLLCKAICDNAIKDYVKYKANGSCKRERSDIITFFKTDIIAEYGMPFDPGTIVDRLRRLSPEEAQNAIEKMKGEYKEVKLCSSL